MLIIIGNSRSKVKSSKRMNNANEFKIEDLFGTVSFSKDSSNYPTTVPIAKGTTRNNTLLNDIFDTDNKHASASVALPRRRQPQQVFISNNKYEI